MNSSSVVLLLFCGIFNYFNLVYGHGMLMDPVGRSSRWRLTRGAPTNYDDNNVNCGGVHTQIGNDFGCGTCGDSKNLLQPRPNELGGKYGQGTLVKAYRIGSTMTVGTQITANHLGYLHFQICNLDKFKIESDECFAEHGQLKTIKGSIQEFIGSKSGMIYTQIVLPLQLKCKHCVFRWHYVAGNNWGTCPNGGGALGCGKQETYRNCADITIL